jgi:hypothetical protein
MVEPNGHCPYLGLKQNQAIRFASPTPEHRCYAAGQAQEIPAFEPNYQASYCLSANHVRCPLYTGRGLPSTPPPPLPLAPRLEPALAPAGGLRGWLAGLPLRDRAIYGLLLSLLALIFLIYAVAGVGLLSTGALFGGGPAPSVAPTSDGGQIPPVVPSPSPSPEPATATDAPSPTTTRTARPRATPSPTARATRTARPTASATPTEGPLPTIEALTWTPSPTARPLPPTPIPPTWTPAPTNTPSDLTPLPPATPEPPTAEPSSTSEPPTAEPPTPEPPTPEPPTEDPPPTEGPPPDPARTPGAIFPTPLFRR